MKKYKILFVAKVVQIVVLLGFIFSLVYENYPEDWKIFLIVFLMIWANNIKFDS